MKKHLFLFVLAFIGIAGTVFGQTPATLPYGCDFESPGDNGWTLKNGECVNQWHIGTPSGAESASLFISGDGGTTTVYNTGATSVVVAEKLFQTGTSDYLSVSFDLTIGGEGSYDYLKVFWVPADTNYEATTNYSVYYAQNDYTPNVIMSNATYATHRFVCNLLGTQRMTAIVANEPNSLKKLVFVWTNDNSGGNQPGAIIDNIRIAPACPPITDLTVNNITETSAEVNWNGGSSSYKVRVNGGAAETITTTSKTFTGLTPSTAYTVEVRGICSETSDADWKAITFHTIQTPATLPYTCNFEASDDNGWILKNGECTNRWYVGTPSGAESASLFISGDGGTTAGYNTNSFSVVVAEKLFQTGTSDSLDISFDLTVRGELRYDYLKIFWVPADTNYEATQSDIYYAERDYKVNAIMSNAADTTWRIVNLLQGTQRMSAAIANEPNSLKKLVFVWKNDSSGGNQPGAIIDNLEISEVREADMQTPAQLPYTCDFEAEGDNEWILKNGICTNRWYVGTHDSATNASLYISGDNGVTAGYNRTMSSVVVAEKLFQTDESDYLSVSFDLTIGGEGSYDYLKVFWVPADTNYEAAADEAPYYAKTWYDANLIMNDHEYGYEGDYFVNLLQGTKLMRAVVANEPNSLRKLVFVWRNDGSSGTQPGAIIDNIRIAPACPPITDITANNITETSAEVSWNGTSSSYEVRINGGATETVTTASKTFTGLTNGTVYTVEVRSVCPEMNDADWQAITFYTLQTPAQLPYTCDFEAEDNNGWIIKNGNFSNKWFIGTPAGETSRSLYISGDGGVTAGMNIYGSDFSVAIAEKVFLTDTSDYINISFDLQMDERFVSENGAGVLKVFWIPADSIFEATANPSFPFYDLLYGENVIMHNCIMDTTTVFCTHGFGARTEMNATVVNEPNSLKKLVFAYICQTDEPFETPIIDNISIKGVNEQCEAPTDLVVSNISPSEATVSWTGSATDYEVRLNNGVSEMVSGTSKTFTGLTPGESYSVLVRTACTESYSQWEQASFSTPQYPASIPYFCDFEGAGNNGWILKNGTCVNRWYIGTPDSATTASLYISNNNGATAGYDTDAESVVVVEKLFQTGTSDSLTISFDLTIMGEDNYDYLKVFWVPADTNYEAVAYERPYYAKAGYTTNVIMSNVADLDDRYISELEGTQRMSVTIANEPNSLKKLVFVWRNDGSEGDNPGAIIDNLSITENSNGSAEPCDVPTGLSVSNITETGATLSWNGEASTYEIKLNGGTAETVSGTSKTLTGLVENTVYMAEVRAVCEEGAGSAWVSIIFRTLAPAPVLNTLEATDITATSATLNGSLDANGRLLTAKGFEYRKQGSEDWTELVVTSTIENMSFALTNLEAATTYEYRVMAKTEENTYTGNIVLFTTLETTGLAEVEHSVSAVVYPNPARDRAALRLNGLTANARLIVSDIQGKIVMSDSIAKGSERYELDLKGFASGVYSVTIICGNNKTTQKLIVE